MKNTNMIRLTLVGLVLGSSMAQAAWLRPAPKAVAPVVAKVMPKSFVSDHKLALIITAAVAGTALVTSVVDYIKNGDKGATKMSMFTNYFKHVYGRIATGCGFVGGKAKAGYNWTADATWRKLGKKAEAKPEAKPEEKKEEVKKDDAPKADASEAKPEEKKEEKKS